MTKFGFYEKRRYRRITFHDSDGVYCTIAGKSISNKAVTVPATDSSQDGLKFSVPPTMDVDFTQGNGLILKAIVGSSSLTFSEPIAFEAKWQNLNEKNRIHNGHIIAKIRKTSEERFVSFIEKECRLKGRLSRERS